MMNCGMEAEIIAYRRTSDIDIQFEDGIIVEHRKYGNFKNGKNFNPACRKKIDRSGEKRVMNCGMEAEIITYRKYDDIDVQFENGYVVEHRKYDSFLKGSINNPSVSNKNILKKNLAVQKTKSVQEHKADVHESKNGQANESESPEKEICDLCNRKKKVERCSRKPISVYHKKPSFFKKLFLPLMKML